MKQIAISGSTEPLQLWERIEIVVGDGASAGHYIARLEDFTGNGIVISAPEFVRGDTLLRDQSECIVLLTRDDAVYQFSTRIHLIHRPPHRTYMLVSPREVRRVQRRQFVRVEHGVRVGLWLLDESAGVPPSNRDQTWIDAIAVNFSGGGMLVKTRGSADIEPADALVIHIPEFEILEFPPKLAAICRRVYADKDEFFYGVEFIREDQFKGTFADNIRNCLPVECHSFDKMMQNKLVNYVFNYQLDLRRKGLL